MLTGRASMQWCLQKALIYSMVSRLHNGIIPSTLLSYWHRSVHEHCGVLCTHPLFFTSCALFGVALMCSDNGWGIAQLQLYISVCAWNLFICLFHCLPYIICAGGFQLECLGCACMYLVTAAAFSFCLPLLSSLSDSDNQSEGTRNAIHVCSRQLLHFPPRKACHCQDYSYWGSECG